MHVEIYQSQLNTHTSDTTLNSEDKNDNNRQLQKPDDATTHGVSYSNTSINHNIDAIRQLYHYIHYNNTDKDTPDTLNLYDLDVDIEKSDGEIDDFKQGKSGHCWLLSAIIAVNNTPEGRQLIKDSIVDNGDGTYTVTFPGDPTMPIVVTEEELAHYFDSSGDIDVAIIEAAARKYYAATKGRDTADGGRAEGVELLTGINVNKIVANQTPEWLKQEILNANKEHKESGHGDIIMMFATDTWRNPDGSLHDVGDNGGGHMLAIVDIDEEANTISYINPWDSSEIITEDLDQFVETQTQVKWGGDYNADVWVYSAPGEIEVHPKIQTLAEDLTPQESQNILSDLGLEEDANGLITDEALYAVMHNITDGVEYTDEQRAAAYAIWKDRTEQNKIIFQKL